MLRIEAPELTKLLLSLGLEKLPSTRKGEGYYIEDACRKSHIDDLVANLRMAKTLNWIYEYSPVVGDDKRYEIARTIIDHHMLMLKHVDFGTRLAKNAKEKFVDDLLADFHLYGFFNQQKKELVCRVAKILVSVAIEDVTKS